MIETAAIITKGGVLLWYYTFNILDGVEKQRDTLQKFIEKYIVEENTDFLAKVDYLSVEWTSINNISAAIIVLYDTFDEIKTFVEKLKTEFLASISDDSIASLTDPTDIETKLIDLFQKKNFNQNFFNVLDQCEKDSELSQNQQTSKKSGRIKKNSSKSLQKDSGRNNEKKKKNASETLDYSIDTRTERANPKRDGTMPLDMMQSISTTVKKNTSKFFNNIVTRIHQTVTSVTGNQLIDTELLNPVLEELKDHLIGKNVATDVAIQITDSVGKSIIGTKTASFTSIKNATTDALSNTIKKILCPSTQVDIIKSIHDAKQHGKVYSICFLGINGVGKSTNLAKIAYYLKTKGKLNVMIAACDTFRSGAIEQLKTHAENLDIKLFQQGYGKDPAITCKLALKHAQETNMDVVLIDTAGRMQDNEPLMRALVKLITINNPDLILFIGEALFGNDSVDQLKKFHKCLINYAPYSEKEPRSIDGLIITKMDTVDEKIGTALTMAYVSGKPIVFIGTGQKYPDLQPLHVENVIDSLLS